MEELATYDDAHNAGFEVYPVIWKSPVNVSIPKGSFKPYPYQNFAPVLNITKYEDAFPMNEFITRADFNADAGSFVNSVYSIPGIWPVPEDIRLYANNEYIPKSALIMLTGSFDLTWAGSADTPWVLTTNLYSGEIFTGSSYPDYSYGFNRVSLPMKLYTWGAGYDNYYGGKVYVYAHVRESWEPDGLVWHHISTFDLVDNGSYTIYVPEGV